LDGSFKLPKFCVVFRILVRRTAAAQLRRRVELMGRSPLPFCNATVGCKLIDHFVENSSKPLPTAGPKDYRHLLLAGAIAEESRSAENRSANNQP
jgi:hypothetical protein